MFPWFFCYVGLMLCRCQEFDRGTEKISRKTISLFCFNLPFCWSSFLSIQRKYYQHTRRGNYCCSYVEHRKAQLKLPGIVFMVKLHNFCWLKDHPLSGLSPIEREQ